MTIEPRIFATPIDGLRAFYEEEFSGEAFFATLSNFHEGQAREALALMSEIETAVINTLAPMARRLGIAPTDPAALRAEGRAEAVALKDVGWGELLARMCAEYPAFVAEFEAVAEAAAPQDRAAAILLLEHEIALLEFARAAQEGEAANLGILRRFLARIGG